MVVWGEVFGEEGAGFLDAEEEGFGVVAFFEVVGHGVAEGRDLTKEQVDAVAKGRVWTGRQAVSSKLADEVGGLRQALDYARKQANLSEDAPLVELPVPERSLLLEAAGFAHVEAQTISTIPSPVRHVLKAVAPLVIHPANKAQTRLELTVEPLD